MIDRHFTATGLVFNTQMQILLIRHKKLGIWLPPGGHVEPNETPDHAVLREIYEETGIEAALLPNGEATDAGDEYAKVLATPFSVYDEDILAQKKHFHIDLIYLCVAKTSVLQANLTETEGLAWFREEQIASLDSYHNARAIIIKAFDHVKQNPSLLAL